MTFLADANFPRPAVEALRQAGIDVLSIAERSPGAQDEEVLSLRISTGRILLTFDKDFGELAYRRGLPFGCGILLFRVGPQSPEEIAMIALSTLRTRQSWAGLFSVVTRKDSNPASSASAPRSTRSFALRIELAIPYTRIAEKPSLVSAATKSAPVTRGSGSCSDGRDIAALFIAFNHDIELAWHWMV